MGANTLRETAGKAGLATTCRSITAVITVQTACFTEAALTRHTRSASQATQAKPKERTHRMARYPTKSVCDSISTFLFSILQARDPFRQALQFLLIQHFVV